MPLPLKPLLPFVFLGAAGVVGVVSGSGGPTGDSPATPAPPPTTTTTTHMPVHVEASLEHQTLPAGVAGETFLRVAVTGAAVPASTHRAAVGLTLVVDRSGSMGSERKMQTANDAACKALQALQAGDTFAVVSFDDGAERIAGGRAPAAVADACHAIHMLSSRGGTDMDAGLQVGGREALAMAGPGRVSRLLLLSDGRPNDDRGLREHAALLAKRGVTTTTIGLGTNYNEDLMASIANAGVGNTWFVESRPEHADTAPKLAEIFRTELSSMNEVVARGGALTIMGGDFTVAEVVGFDSEASPTRRIGRRVVVGDIYSGHTTEVLVRLTHPAHTAGDQATIDVSFAATSPKDEPLALAPLTIAATYSKDASVVAASRVITVTEKVEEHRTTQALLAANEAWNRGDQDGGDAILNAQKVQVQHSASALGSTKLQALFSDVDAYQRNNAAVGSEGRAAMNKVAKEKARDYARSAKKGRP
jgi:Ca-activated chloride channel family protein